MKRRALERVVERALADVDLERLVARALARKRVSGRVRVLAIGKAALPMAAGALESWGDAIDEVVVVQPGPARRSKDRREHVLQAAHPLPDARSVRAGVKLGRETGLA